MRELGEVHRLADVAVGAKPVAFQPILILDRRRENDDRQELRSRIGADSLQHLVAVELRQLQIQQNQLRQLGCAAVGSDGNR